MELIDDRMISSLLINHNGFEKTIVIGFINPASVSALYDCSFNFRCVKYWCIDAQSLVVLLNRHLPTKIIRASFDTTSIFRFFCDIGTFEKKKRITFIGGTEAEAISAELNLTSLVSNMVELRVLSGFFGSTFPQSYIEAMEASDFVVFSMGACLQEKFSLDALKMFPKGKLIFTAGAFVSQSSVGPFYYPKFISKFHLRWLYRALNESHVRHRLLFIYPKFFWNYRKYLRMFL